MRNRIAIVALLSTCLTVPSMALAQTVGVGVPMVSAGQAQAIALVNGVVVIRKIEFDDGTWKVEGRDHTGRDVEMKIDARSGQIVRLQRD